MVLVGNLAATFYRLDKRHYNNQAKNRAICGLRLTALHWFWPSGFLELVPLKVIKAGVSKMRYESNAELFVLILSHSVCWICSVLTVQSTWRSPPWCREHRGCWSRTGPLCPALLVSRCLKIRIVSKIKARKRPTPLGQCWVKGDQYWPFYFQIYKRMEENTKQTSKTFKLKVQLILNSSITSNCPQPSHITIPLNMINSSQWTSLFFLLWIWVNCPLNIYMIMNSTAMFIQSFSWGAKSLGPLSRATDKQLDPPITAAGSCVESHRLTAKLTVFNEKLSCVCCNTDNKQTQYKLQLNCSQKWCVHFQQHW